MPVTPSLPPSQSGMTQPMLTSSNTQPSVPLPSIWSGRQRSKWSLPYVAPIPFGFPSLEHLDARVDSVIADVAKLEGLQESTRVWAGRSYRSLRKFLKTSNRERQFIGGDVRAQVQVLQQWVAWLREAGLARTAINSYWRGCAAVTRWIQRRDGTVDPFSYAPVPGVGKLQPRCLPREAAERFLAVVQHYPWASHLQRSRNVAIVGLMLLAGLRRGELLRLGATDIDLDAGTIRIIRGKGANGGTDRTAYIPAQLNTVLATYLQDRLEAKRTHPELLTSLRTNAGISASVLRNLFRDMSDASGIRVSPHMLRHTYATLLHQAGVPDRLLMELLGHTTVQMTYRYAHVFSHEAKSQAQRLHLGSGLNLSVAD